MEISRAETKIRLIVHSSLEEVTVERSFNSSEQQSLEEAWAAHGEYLANHISVVMDGAPLKGTLSLSEPPHQEDGFIVFTLDFPISDTARGPLTISQNVLNEFEFAPGNPWEATFLVTEREHNRDAPQLLSRATPITITEESAGSSMWSVFREFLHHGIEHILGGYDHLLFASALVVGAATFFDVVRVIAAFTLAHTCTLVLTTFHIIRLPASVVEPLIALSIVIVSLLNLFPSSQKQRRRSVAMAFFFGLFHGMGFAGGLADAMGTMASSALWVALAGFSIGVELGHQLIVVPLYAALAATRSLDKRHAWRLTPTFVKALSLMLTAGGLYFLAYTL